MDAGRRGIAVQPNAMCVLHELGIGSTVDRAGAGVRRWLFCDRHGELLCDIALKPRASDPPQSMILSAKSTTDRGILMPSFSAVCRLMTNSNLIGCSTGMSAGLAPFKILST